MQQNFKTTRMEAPTVQADIFECDLWFLEDFPVDQMCCMLIRSVQVVAGNLFCRSLVTKISFVPSESCFKYRHRDLVYIYILRLTSVDCYQFCFCQGFWNRRVRDQCSCIRFMTQSGNELWVVVVGGWVLQHLTQKSCKNRD